MDRAAIVACLIMVVGVVMSCATAQPSIQRNARRFMLAPAWGSWSCRPMSPFGQNQTSDWWPLMSALPSKADIAERDRHFRYVPQADSCTQQVYARPAKLHDWHRAEA